ncbi:unnamed protein product [Knipowitschia caucasica]|uniref:Meteorin-like protein n=1 Tax=Knipowitschia caucasica TaxID=637954 RepID=A0AAV2KJW0_KNICA
MDEMLYSVIILYHLSASLICCTADFCNWTGSSTQEEAGLVLQVRLRCAAGWVRWFSAGQALRVVLEPSLSTFSPRVCIQASPTLRGLHMFTERSGRLQLLTTGREKTSCIDAHGETVIYLQVSVQSPASRGRTVGFQYELTYPGPGASPHLTGLGDPCRPCSDTQLLMAICTSDFVVRGTIQKVSHNSARQTSLINVSVTKVYTQRGSLFEQPPTSPLDPSLPRSAHISTLLQCHIKPGKGEFLFTGSKHFGRAWLGCAPRFKDFLSVYHSARAARSNPCDFLLD